MPHAHALRIDLALLEEGVHTFTRTPSIETLDLDPARFDAVEVEVLVNYFNDRALVLITASAIATLECDRTLKPFTQAISGQYEVLFVPASFSKREEETTTDAYDELQEIPAGRPELDLTAFVRDTLLLAIPARCVSPEAEALELQTTFGALTDEEGNTIDPRWEALRKLKTDDADAT